MKSLNDILDRMQSIFRDVFDDRNIELQMSTCADDIEDWDSLAQMDLIVSIEKEYGIKFTLDEILRLENVGNMAELIQNKLR